MGLVWISAHCQVYVERLDGGLRIRGAAAEELLVQDLDQQLFSGGSADAQTTVQAFDMAGLFDTFRENLGPIVDFVKL